MDDSTFWAAVFSSITTSTKRYSSHYVFYILFCSVLVKSSLYWRLLGTWGALSCFGPHVEQISSLGNNIYLYTLSYLFGPWMFYLCERVKDANSVALCHARTHAYAHMHAHNFRRQAAISGVFLVRLRTKGCQTN